MKTKELMIGDWVKNFYGKNARVEQILENGVMLVYNDTFSFGEIEPIPLTEEILKKNGFEYNDSLAEWTINSFCVEFGHEAFKEEHDQFFVWVSNCQVILNYVHEIQHALRLCKIDKEIEL